MGTSKAWAKRPDAKNRHAPQGKHWCYMHNDGEGAYLPKDQFHKNKRKVHGLNDRCRSCATKYRKRYEKQNGERNQLTKTVRIPNKAHAVVKQASAHRGTTTAKFLVAAIKFYLKHGCRSGTCGNPATPTGLCSHHTGIAS